MLKSTTMRLHIRLSSAILLSSALLVVLLFWVAEQPLAAITVVNTRGTGPTYASSAFHAAYPITCSLTITTTDILTHHQSFTVALPLASYQNLALVSGTQLSQVQAHDDYFVVNPKPGTFYQIEAIPTLLGNYNLGMVVYDYSYQPIVTDINPLDGYPAKVNWMAGTAAPYYLVVSQISNMCTGGYYNLTVHDSGYWTYLPTIAKGH
jgi:hypothetical protein